MLAPAFAHVQLRIPLHAKLWLLVPCPVNPRMHHADHAEYVHLSKTYASAHAYMGRSNAFPQGESSHHTALLLHEASTSDCMQVCVPVYVCGVRE